MKNTTLYSAGSKLILGMTLVATLSGCGFQDPPLGIFSWRVNTERPVLVADNEIYSLKGNTKTNAFTLTRYQEKKPVWSREFSIALDPDDTDSTDSASIKVAGLAESSRRIALVVKTKNKLFVLLYDQNGNRLQQAELSLESEYKAYPEFNAQGDKLFVMITQTDGSQSNAEVYELDNDVLSSRFQRQIFPDQPNFHITDDGAVIKLNQSLVIGLDEHWQPRWQLIAPTDISFGHMLANETTALVTQQGVFPGINFIDSASGAVRFVATTRTPYISALGSDGNPYVLEYGYNQYLKKIDSDGNVLFQSTATYNEYRSVQAVKELASGERVILSSYDQSEGDVFVTNEVSRIDWINADGTTARSYTAPGKHSYHPYDCLLCGSDNDRPGYFLKNIHIEADGDIFASGSYSSLLRASKTSSLWRSQPFFGKVDLSKVDP